MNMSIPPLVFGNSISSKFYKQDEELLKSIPERNKKKIKNYLMDFDLKDELNQIFDKYQNEEDDILNNKLKEYFEKRQNFMRFLIQKFGSREN